MTAHSVPVPPAPARWPMRILWGSLILSILSSYGHVAFVYGDLEPTGPAGILTYVSMVTGLLAALAIEGAVASMAWSLGRLRRLGRPTLRLKLGLWFVLLMAMTANFEFTIRAETDVAVTWPVLTSLDPWLLIRAVLWSATLPLVVVVLAGIVEDLGTEDAPATASSDSPLTVVPSTEPRHALPAAPVAPEPVQPEPARIETAAPGLLSSGPAAHGTLPVYGQNSSSAWIDDDEPHFGDDTIT